MDDRELASSLESSQTELGGPDVWREELRREFEALERLLESGGAPDAALQTIDQWVVNHSPGLLPRRGGERVGDGLEATRAAVQEIHNRVKKLGSENR